MAEKNVQKIQGMKRKKPSFKRTDWYKQKRLSRSGWRKPKGRDNKVRRRIRGALVQAGYGNPSEIRGMHPSGFLEKMISNKKELAELNVETEAARISASVGKRKRIEIIKEAEKKKIKVLNPGKKTLDAIENEKKAKLKEKETKTKKEGKPVEKKKTGKTKKQEEGKTVKTQ